MGMLVKLGHIINSGEMLNPFFDFTTAANEQNLVEDMIIESIQIYGMHIVIAPKILVNYNELLGEDTMRAFRSYYTVEAYFDNVEGWMGDKNFLNQMGLNIDKQAKFAIAKKRFDQVTNPAVTWRGSWVKSRTYNLNDGVNFNGKLYKSLGSSNKSHTPTAGAPWAAVVQNRPEEGDIVFLPITHDIFEVVSVDFEEVFYQLGKIYVWKITCEKWRNSHEEVDTGHSEIDAIAADIEAKSGDDDPLADNEEIQEQIEDFLNLDDDRPF